MTDTTITTTDLIRQLGEAVRINSNSLRVLNERLAALEQQPRRRWRR